MERSDWIPCNLLKCHNGFGVERYNDWNFFCAVTLSNVPCNVSLDDAKKLKIEWRVHRSGKKTV